MIEVENTDVNIVRNLIPMRNLMPSERLWSESHFRLVYLNFSLKCDFWHEKFFFSRTPLHFAAYNGYINILTLLVENGADHDVQDKDGLTPQDYALAHDQCGAYDYLNSL